MSLVGDLQMATRRKAKDVEAAVKAVSETDVKKVLDEVGSMQTNVQGTLAALGVTLASKITELRNLELATTAQKEELKTIHDIEVQADTLDNITAQTAEAAAKAQEYEAKRRKEWLAATAEQAVEAARELENHKYETTVRHERAVAEFTAASEERQRQEGIRIDDVNKQLAARIESVGLREDTVGASEELIEGIPGQIAAAVEEAVKATTASLTKGFGFESRMLKKDAEAQEALAAARAEAFEAQIAALQGQLESSETQLKAARDDARAISTAAVEAAGQKQALDTLQKSMETTAAANGTSRRS